MKPSLLVPWLLCAALSAQMPFRYLWVGEAYAATNPGLRIVDPTTGVSSFLIPDPNSTVAPMRNALTVAIDPNDRGAVYLQGGIAVSLGPPITRFGLTGTRIATQTTKSVTGVTGQVGRYIVVGTDLWFTLPGSTNAGVWKTALPGGQATQVLPLPSAFDLALAGAKVYALTKGTSVASTIVEIDVATLAPRTLGTSYPALTSLTAMGPQLLCGAANGDVIAVAIASGAHSPFASPNKGAITAIVTDPVTSMPFFATDRNEIWLFPQLITPICTTPNKIQDLDVSPLALAAVIFHGTACKGSNGKLPGLGFVALPSLGNAAFGFDVRNGLPAAPGWLLLGASRTLIGTQPLPFDLTSLNMPGCWLNTDLLLTLPIVLDASGSFQVPLPIPNSQALVGGRLMAQPWLRDAAANGLGYTTGEAQELIVR